MKRKDSRNQGFVKRIPIDLMAKVGGRRLTFSLGDEMHSITINPGAKFVKFSLRTHDPVEVKARHAAVAAHFERVFQALREDTPLRLTNGQATALAGRLYRAWANSERRERTFAVEQGPDGKMRPVAHDPQDDEEVFKASLIRLVRPTALGKAIDLDHLPPAEEKPEPTDLESTLWPLVSRLLLAEGIGKVDPPSRALLLVAFWRALRHALEHRKRNALGDYSPDPNSERFPAWVSPLAPPAASTIKSGSLTALIEDWWCEAKAAGRKPSTYESYRNTMAKLVAVLKHDDARKVTPEDVVKFKDFRIANGVSPKTVKDGDLAGLKTIFGWAVMNRRMSTNPAEGLTIKVSKPRKLRSKGFTDKEATALLKHAKHFRPRREAAKLAAAKRWVPWLCAFTGARVGEMLQLRKKDVRHEGKHWVIHVTPEAGPVKTDEARDIVLHRQLIDTGFVKFLEASPHGYLFITPGDGELDVRKAVKTARNKVNEFVRAVVPDPNVDPSHGWRHRFKTIGIDEGADMRVLDAIQGHAPRNNSEGYGDVTIKARANAIAKFPNYEV